MKFRREIWLEGYRYRKHYGEFKIDVAFPGKKVAVFIDSCFWHFCPEHGTIPLTRSVFWEKKLRRNRERDRFVTCALRIQGWRVVRFWEHDLKSNPQKALQRLKMVLEGRKTEPRLNRASHK